MLVSKLQISEDQLDEWTENPVTVELARLVQEELQRIQDTPIQECLMPGEPFKTQDNLTDLEARFQCYMDLAAFLGGNWDYLLEGSDDFGIE